MCIVKGLYFWTKVYAFRRLRSRIKLLWEGHDTWNKIRRFTILTLFKSNLATTRRETKRKATMVQQKLNTKGFDRKENPKTMEVHRKNCIAGVIMELFLICYEGVNFFVLVVAISKILKNDHPSFKIRVPLSMPW